MRIKEGFNGNPTTIKIYTQENGSIELWIEETGKGTPETLSYLSKDELYELFKEVKLAGKDLFN